VVVATPGRCVDLLDRGVLDLSEVRYLVLDECDKVLSLGLEIQMRSIIASCSNPERQTVMFSATIPMPVQRLVNTAMVRDPIYIRCEKGTIAQNILHKVVIAEVSDKMDILLTTLRRIPSPPVLVFCNHQTTVDRVAHWLRDAQFHVAGLHGGKPQSWRDKVMATLTAGWLDVLVATDVAARGIDIPELCHVIVYDMPDSIEDYTHRVGRTGRNGQFGEATAFVNRECSMLPEFISFLKSIRQDYPPEIEMWNTSHRLRSWGGSLSPRD